LPAIHPEWVFLMEEVLLPLPASEARSRLVGYLRAEGLQGVSESAFSEGQHLLVRAGVRGVSKEVQVQVLPAYVHGDAMVLPLRWVATGPTGAMFPQLDANLEIAWSSPTESVLRLAGTYRPPMGMVGNTLDRVLLHRVAEATSRALIHRLANALADTASTVADSQQLTAS
jgi:hypothetical protein